MCRRQVLVRKHIPLSFEVTATDNSQNFQIRVNFIPDEVWIKYMTFVDFSDVLPLSSVDDVIYVTLPRLIPSDTPLAVIPVSMRGQTGNIGDLVFPLKSPVSVSQTVTLFNSAYGKPDITGTFMIGLEFVKYSEE